MPNDQHSTSPAGDGTKSAYLTVPEVADLLRVSRMTVYRLLDRGELRGYRMSRCVRIDRRDLTAYLRSADTTGGAA